MTAPATLVPIRQRTPEWHAYRRDRITATDAAVIAGERGSVVELFAYKAGLLEPPEPDEATRELMDEGLAIEPYLLDYYRRRTGARVRAIHTMRQSKEWPVAVSSPDGEVVGERRGVEAKMTTSARWAAARDGDEGVPGDVLAQVQWQMYTAGWEAVDVVVLLFGRPRIVPIARDDAYLADLVWLARDFWSHVERGEQPPVNGSENARQVLARLHPYDDGRLVAADPVMTDLVHRLAAAKAAAKAARDEEATLENAIRALLGDAAGVEGEGFRVTWKNNREIDWETLAREIGAPADLVAAHTSVNWKAVAETLRPRPEAIARHSAPSGPRVLRPSGALFRGGAS